MVCPQLHSCRPGLPKPPVAASQGRCFENFPLASSALAQHTSWVCSLLSFPMASRAEPCRVDWITDSSFVSDQLCVPGDGLPPPQGEGENLHLMEGLNRKCVRVHNTDLAHSRHCHMMIIMVLTVFKPSCWEIALCLPGSQGQVSKQFRFPQLHPTPKLPQTLTGISGYSTRRINLAVQIYFHEPENSLPNLRVCAWGSRRITAVRCCLLAATPTISVWGLHSHQV